MTWVCITTPFPRCQRLTILRRVDALHRLARETHVYKSSSLCTLAMRTDGHRSRGWAVSYVPALPITGCVPQPDL